MATAAAAPQLAVAEEAKAPPTSGGTAPLVVELYTSQGCSSCPPADKFLGDLTKAKGVIALSFHVTYWNHLGWPDDLSSPEATRRQRIYRWSLRERFVYTPQMVVQGRYGAVGSNRYKVATYMSHLKGAKGVPLSLSQAGDKLTIRIGKAAWAAEKLSDVFLFLVDSAHTRKIGRGENTGRTITYHNVVREIVRLGNYRGEALTLTASARGKGGARRNKAVVVVQNRRVGPIIGARLLALK